MGPYAHKGSANGLATGNSSYARAKSLFKLKNASIYSQHRHGAHDRDSLAIIDVIRRKMAIHMHKWWEMDSFGGDKTRNVAIRIWYT